MWFPPLSYFHTMCRGFDIAVALLHNYLFQELLPILWTFWSHIPWNNMRDSILSYFWCVSQKHRSAGKVLHVGKLQTPHITFQLSTSILDRVVHKDIFEKSNDSSHVTSILSSSHFCITSPREKRLVEKHLCNLPFKIPLHNNPGAEPTDV